MTTIQGRALVEGSASAEALTAKEPLSFWGGYDQFTGQIIDRRHPLSGTNAIGKVLVLPGSRGSSTTAAVLLEAVRRHNAPAVIITIGTDRFLTLAAIVAFEMYSHTVGIVSVEAGDFEKLLGASEIQVDVDGTITRVS
jgi:predicted aconitase with swiveling domain